MTLILKDKYLRGIFGISLFLLVFTSLLTFLKLKNISNPLVVHFDIYSGIDFFGGRGDILGILIMTFVILGVNYWVANFLYNKERFLAYIFAFSSLVIAILILISMSVIISIN